MNARLHEPSRQHASAPALQLSRRALSETRRAGWRPAIITRRDSLVQRRPIDSQPDASLLDRPAMRATSLTSVVSRGLSSPAQPLDADTHAFMAPRFGWDFSGIRVHTGAEAAQSAHALHARAYSVGSHIVFARGEFCPATPAGRHLLAHELAHAIQQQGRSDPIAKIGRADDSAEREAEAAASHVVADAPTDFVPRSLAMDAGGSLRRAPVPAWGGEFDIGDKGYAETYEEAPREGRVRPGVIFHLKFTPNQIVDAEEIAFVQAVTSLVNDQPHAVNPTAGARSIPQGDPGEGMHIDVGPSRKTPFITDQTGVHYQDKTRAYSRDAEMIDDPGFPIRDTDSAEMTFTTSVTATKGTQAGAYYGGVRWGWRREPKQRPKKMPLTAEPAIVPGGSLFKTIAVLWDKSKTSGQLPTEHLPTVTVKYTTKSTRVVLDPAKPRATGSFDLSVGTQVEVLETADPTNKGFQRIIVIAGTHRGKMGWTSEALNDTEPLKPKAKRR